MRPSKPVPILGAGMADVDKWRASLHKLHVSEVEQQYRKVWKVCPSIGGRARGPIEEGCPKKKEDYIKLLEIHYKKQAVETGVSTLEMGPYVAPKAKNDRCNQGTSILHSSLWYRYH